MKTNTLARVNAILVLFQELYCFWRQSSCLSWLLELLRQLKTQM